MCAEIWTSLVHVWMWAPLPLGSVLFTPLLINKTLLQRLVSVAHVLLRGTQVASVSCCSFSPSRGKYTMTIRVIADGA